MNDHMRKEVRILFLVPPTHNKLLMEYDHATNDAMGTYIPPGLISLATFLKEKLGNSVLTKIIDCSVGQWNNARFKEAILEYRPDMVCMTVFTPLVLDVIRSLETIKQLLSSCLTVIGGAHVTSFQEAAVSHPEIDYAVMGYGEYPLWKLVSSLFFDRNILRGDIPGLIYRQDGEIKKNPINNSILSLDDLPLPDLSLVDYKRYSCPIGTRTTMVPVISSRGCPFHCTFCNSPDKVYMPRSMSKVFEEVMYIHSLGVEEIFFFDDLFNLTNDRVYEFCDLLKKEKLKITWAFKSRVHNVTENFIRTVKSCGCERIHFGIETHTDESLKTLRKGITVKQIEDAINLCYRYRINTVGSFMINLPGDTLDDIHERFRFAKRLRLDYAQFAILIAYSHTEIFDEGVRLRFWDKDIWLRYIQNPTEDFIAPIWETGISRGILYELVKTGFSSFYFRPQYIWQRLRNLHSFDELKKYITGMRNLAN
jgi:Fe-S oxidoreductase